MAKLPHYKQKGTPMEISTLKFGLEIAAALVGIICIAFFAYVTLLSGKAK
jgi:hypothetical protein